MKSSRFDMRHRLAEDHFTIGFGQVRCERDSPIQHALRFGVIERVQDARNVEQGGGPDDRFRSLGLFQGV